MSQIEILEFLAKNPKEYYSCHDIANYLESTPSKINKQLRMMRKYKELRYKKTIIGCKQTYIYKMRAK